MPTYTFKVESVCTGGEHVTISLYKDAVKVGTKEVTRTDLRELDVTVAEAVLFLMRQSIKDRNASTAAQIKKAIEGIQVSL